MDFVDHLKSSVDIVRTVGEYVRLRKIGAALLRSLSFSHRENSFLQR